MGVMPNISALGKLGTLPVFSTIGLGKLKIDV